MDEYFGTWRRVLAASEWRGDELIREVSSLRQTIKDRDAVTEKREEFIREQMARADSLTHDLSAARDQAAVFEDDSKKLRRALAESQAAHAAAEARWQQVPRERDGARRGCPRTPLGDVYIYT